MSANGATKATLWRVIAERDAEIAALLEDRARLDWLDTYFAESPVWNAVSTRVGTIHITQFGPPSNLASGPTLRAAIDNARAERSGQGAKNHSRAGVPEEERSTTKENG